MRRIIMTIFVVLQFMGGAEGADSKVSALTDIHDPHRNDRLYIVDDPNGTPASRAICLWDFFNLIDASSELLAIMDDETGTGALVFGTSPTFTTSIITPLATHGTAIAIGDNTPTVAIDSSDWDISTTGVMTGIGNITSDGTIEGATLTEGGVAVHNNDEMDASSELAAIIDDETGSGLIMFATSPTITTSLEIGADDSGAYQIDVHDAGTILMRDDSDDTSVTIGPVADGTTTLGITGSLNVSASIVATSLSGLSIISGSYDASGAEDMDYGSADVTDHTFTTDDCTVIIDGGITVSTGDTITLGSTAWNSSDNIDGEVIADDTIDNDSIDWGDMTDLTTDGAVVWGNIAEGELADSTVISADIKDDTIDSADYAAGSIDAEHLAADVIDETKIADDGIDSEHYNDGSIDAAHLAADVIDETKIADDGIDSEHYNADSIDNEHINWADIDNLGDEGAVTLSATVTVSDDEDTDDGHEVVFTTDNATMESDGDFTYNPSSGTVTATEFSGGGGSLTGVDAATGDSATAFFDAGTIEHEYGGLEADVSDYSGLVAISGGSTAEIDALSELLGQLADVTAFITDDDMPAAAADPDIDAAGEIGRDTDGANETGDSSIRGHDGSNQFLYSRKLKTINFTLISPDQIDAADLIPIWHNTSGMTFTIVEWKMWSDDDDVSLEIEELTDMTDFTARTTVDAVEIATDGTGVYYASDTDITHAAIEHDHSIALDVDTSDTPDYIHGCIIGWFNADVD